MALDHAPRTRRAVLAATLAAAAASVAQALGRPAPIRASDGEAILVGGEYESGTTTSVTCLFDETALMGMTFGNGFGVRGSSTESAGVYGDSTLASGVIGTSFSSSKAANVGWSQSDRTGLEGYSGGGSLPAAPAKTGVYGYAAQDGNAIGVRGQSVDGIGVHGSSTSKTGVTGVSGSNIGVYGFSSTGSGVHGASPSTDKAATVGNASGGSTGVQGYSGAGPLPAAVAKTGVFGYAAQDSTARGVFGRTSSGTGVHGYTGASPVPAPVAKTGLYGRCDTDTSSYGVFGHSTAGTGTRGNTASGTALLGVASDGAGWGLRSIGRVGLQKASGLATIPSGASSVTVTPGSDIEASTFVILTPQADPGTRRLWATTNPTANTITINVSAAVSGSLTVAWLVLG